MTNTHTDTTRSEIEFLKTLLIDKKSLQERQNIMEFKELVKKYKIGKEFLHLNEGEPLTQLFPSYEKFQEFKDKYMVQPAFTEWMLWL